MLGRGFLIWRSNSEDKRAHLAYKEGIICTAECSGLDREELSGVNILELVTVPNFKRGGARASLRNLACLNPEVRQPLT